RRVAEEAKRREDALRLVVADVGREHVFDLVLVVDEEDHAEEPERVALVRVGDDLGDRDVAPVERVHGGRGRERGHRRDQGAGWGGTRASSHRSPNRPRTWNGAGTTPSGVSRRRWGSLTNASGSPARQRRSKRSRARNIWSVLPARYVGATNPGGASR